MSATQITRGSTVLPFQEFGAASKYLQAVLHAVPGAVNAVSETKNMIPPPGPMSPTAHCLFAVHFFEAGLAGAGNCTSLRHF